MEVIILLDHDLEGQVAFLKSALRETGWDRDVHIQFKHLRDFDLPDDCADREIWRRVQAERILLITNNRNREDETSLQATVDRENTPDSLPILTISDQTRLRQPVYRQQVVERLVAIILDVDKYLGTGRLYLP